VVLYLRHRAARTRAEQTAAALSPNQAGQIAANAPEPEEIAQ